MELKVAEVVVELLLAFEVRQGLVVVEQKEALRSVAKSKRPALPSEGIAGAVEVKWVATTAATLSLCGK
jgi:hypothetical protein